MVAHTYWPVHLRQTAAMDADDPRAKKLSYSLHGLRQATLRCSTAHWHRPEDAFIAAAEAVSWVVALDGFSRHQLTTDAIPPRTSAHARRVLPARP
jgi:hypothetical protein